MKAKEKAEQIVNKYEKYLFDRFTNEEDWVMCVECALIAVDQIILANPHSNPFNTESVSTMKYWVDVRKEIDKL